MVTLDDDVNNSNIIYVNYDTKLKNNNSNRKIYVYVVFEKILLELTPNYMKNVIFRFGQRKTSVFPQIEPRLF